MTGYPLLRAGQACILLVAAFFYVCSTLAILIFAVTLVSPNSEPGAPSLVWGLAAAVAPFFLLRGSIFARWSLVAMSIFALLGGLPLLVDGVVFYRVMGVFFVIGGVYSLYVLTSSAEFRREFSRRRAHHRAEEQAGRQKFYDEMEAHTKKKKDPS